MFKSPRGSKSLEHLRVLRQSDPCYGTLMPRLDRPSLHEISYDPLLRFSAMVKTYKQARGAKTMEHLRVLRHSDPCFGTLAPSLDRPSVHEHTYDPVLRYRSMCRTLSSPHGTKHFEPLVELRRSNPYYGSLAPGSECCSAHEQTCDPVA
eukprot:scaffold313111_cov36-Tisochrysis_lutea.AAC.1